MKDGERRRRGLFVYSLMALASLSAFVYLVWALRPLILPVILGILLAYLFRPLKTAFKYRWLPNGIRVAFLFTVLTSGLLVGIKFVKDNIPNEKEKLEILVRMKYKFDERFNKMMNIDPATGKGNVFYNLVARDINPLRASLDNDLQLSPDQREAFIAFHKGVEGFDPVPERFYKYFLANVNQSELPDPSNVDVSKTGRAVAEKNSGGSFLKVLVNILSIWFLLPIVFVFFLLDDGAISHFFLSLVPNRYFELAATLKEEVDGAIGRYLRGISTECALVGISMALGLTVVGVAIKMALLIGILAGLATAIPFLGPVVGLSFGLTYALIAEDIHPVLPFVTMDNLPIAVMTVIAIVLCLDNIVFQPIVLGGAVNLHPLVVIVGIMGASMLFGMAGVLLAIPTIVVLKVVIQHTFRGLKDYRII